MKTLLISIRSSRLDDLPPWLAMEALQQLRQDFPTTPISVCLEHHDFDTPEALLEHLHDDLSQVEDYPNDLSAMDELEWKKSLFWLLKTAQRLKVAVKITQAYADQGSPQLERIATQTPGIIFDLGDIKHSPKIQRQLHHYDNLNTWFFCAYSHRGQQYHSPAFRMMQYIGVPKTCYPAGLDFLSTQLAELNLSSWKRSRLERIERQQVLEKINYLLHRHLTQENRWLARLRHKTRVVSNAFSNWYPKRSLKSLTSPLYN